MITEKLKSKLLEIPFNTYFARSVLEGHVEGDVLFDNENDPSAAYVQHKYGMSLLWGDCNNEEFNIRLKRFLDNRQESTWAQVYPVNWGGFMQGISEQITSRLNFDFLPEMFEKNNKSLNMQSVRKATLDEAKNFTGRVVPSNFWKEAHLPMCVSYVAIANDEAASIAYSSYIHENIIEIGIETVDAHRGKGFAQLACAGLIRHILNTKCVPVWSCRVDNIASLKLAEKLGFIETLKLPYYIIKK